MTIYKLHKLLTKLIADGDGRKKVCVDKSKCNHPCEPEAGIIQITSAEIKTVEVADDEGGMKVLANGCTATRTMLVIEANQGQ